jgi:2-iminoacetate synthase ThiH
MRIEDLKRLIREAGRTPVERDTLYHPLKADITLQAVPV